MTDALRRSRRTRRVGLILVILAMGGAGLGFATSWTNFRVVDVGRFYRSGQLSDRQLVRVIDRYQIRTIINLRGAHPGARWYERERAVARERGVDLVDVDLRSYRLPHKEVLIRLLDAYREAERPILVHCSFGADRAGQAAAIYQLEYMDASKAEALEMLSLRYLHLSLLRPASRYLIQIYRGEKWARTRYDPCREGYRYYDRDKFCDG